MTEIRKIDTLKYNKDGKVDVDGKIWTVKLPGAGTELQMSRVQRRQKFLADKIEKGSYTEEDLDRYDEMEQWLFDFFKTMFTDGTEDNSEVSQWMEDTPLAIILQAFEDIKEQANS